MIATSRSSGVVPEGMPIAGGYPADYKMLFVMLTNPVNQMPNSNKVSSALKAKDRLEAIVVLEQFMTATARYADILLPTNTILERHDPWSVVGRHPSTA
jgi:anaerobic dimethyl sulfoxide reductase subunit A